MAFYYWKLFILTSCGEDGEDIIPITNPTITGFEVDGIDTSGMTLQPGQTVTINVAYDLDGATDVSLIAYIGDSELLILHPLSASSPNPIQTNFAVPADVTEDFTVDYELQETDGSSIDSESFNVTIYVAVDAMEYEAVLLAAPVAERTSKTFFSATSGGTYSIEDVIAETGGITSDSIHFGYYYGNTGQASLASPAEYPTQGFPSLGADGANWSTLNETMFRPVTLTGTFDDVMTSDEVASLFETAGNASESGVINQLQVGDVYAFSFSEGDETNFGVFQVDAIEPGFESNDSITLTVKVAVSE